MKASSIEIKNLEKLYEDRKVFHGELHDHAATGGTSDGTTSLAQWVEDLQNLNMDFAAILDHRQVRHMYLPEWEDGLFIAGTEPGAGISDIICEDNYVHYNMLFESPHDLETILDKFPEYKFTGGTEGHFEYPCFTTARFCELIDAVKAQGGFFVHPHPKQQMKSENPEDYWFRDETGMEVFYEDMANDETKDNYKLWTDLLRMGKRIWATAGGDGHDRASDRALTTIYAEEHNNKSYLKHLRQGDLICGPVGIRMCIGNVLMGGRTRFGKNRLTISVGDFHNVVYKPQHKFRLDILEGDIVVAHEHFSCDKTEYFSFDLLPDAPFIRAEVFDEDDDLRIAIGNPIWNI